MPGRPTIRLLFSRIVRPGGQIVGHYDALIDRTAKVEQYATGSTAIRVYRSEAHDREVRAEHAHNIQLMWESGEDEDDGATSAVAQGTAGGAGGASPPYAVAAADAGPAGASQSRKRRRESEEATAEAEERRATTKRTKGEAATVLQVDEEVEPPEAESPRATTAEAAAAGATTTATGEAMAESTPGTQPSRLLARSADMTRQQWRNYKKVSKRLARGT